MKKDKELSIIYFLQQGFYYGQFCSVISFCSVFLLGKGFDNSSIGLIIALGNIVSLVLQPILSSFCDRHPSHPLTKTILSLLLLIGALTVSLLIVNRNLWISILMILNIGLVNTLAPFINSLAFVYKNQGISINFGLGRAGGSVFYSFTSFLLGQLVGRFSSNILLIFNLAVTILLGIAVIFYKKKGPKQEGIKKENSIEEAISMFAFVKKYKFFTLLLVGMMLVYLDHVFINNFFLQIIRPIGGDETSMGTAIAFAAILEVPMMVFYEKLDNRFGAKNLFLFSIFVFVIKHLLTALSTNMAAIYTAQFLQMLSYAIFAPSSVYFANQLISSKDRVKGQSLLTMSQSVGSVLSALIGGIMIDAFGVKSSLYVTAMLTLFGAMIIFASIHKLNVGRAKNV